MTEHDTAFLGVRQGSEGRVGGRDPAPQPGWLVSHPCLLQLPDPDHSAALPHPWTSHPARATLGPLDLCPSDLEEALWGYRWEK